MFMQVLACVCFCFRVCLCVCFLPGRLQCAHLFPSLFLSLAALVLGALAVCTEVPCCMSQPQKLFHWFLEQESLSTTPLAPLISKPSVLTNVFPRTADSAKVCGLVLPGVTDTVRTPVILRATACSRFNRSTLGGCTSTRRFISCGITGLRGQGSS